MKYIMYAILLASFFSTNSAAQSFQSNGASNALQFNAPAATAIGAAVPIILRTFTGSALDINIQGGSSGGSAQQPLILLYSATFSPGTSISIQAFFAGGVRLDLIDNMAPGYLDQIAIDGFSNPSFGTTDSNGGFSINLSLPSCTQDPESAVCTTQPYTEVSFQAVVVDATHPPFGLNSTGAGTVEIIDGFEEINFNQFISDPFANFVFRDGFTFEFYGQTYSSAFVSENGYIQFGSAAQISNFPNISTVAVLNAPPRIHCFYDDLVFFSGSFSPRVYAEHYLDAGVRKIKFGFEGLSEFGSGITGAHGGEITLTENNEIAILVDPSSAFPSINTVVGISSGLSNAAQTGPGYSPQTGRDLSAGIVMGQAFGAGRSIFELFDHSAVTGGPPMNPLDLIGLDTGNSIGPGFSFIPDPSLTPATSGYIIQ